MKIERLQVELTNKCNARCPLCSRVLVDNLNNREISLKDFKLFFPETFLENINFVLFCGNFGDPIFCKDIIDIHEYIYSCNSDIQIKLNTNGGMRDPEFWSKLGSIYAKYRDTKSAIAFGIDGLEDTNHLYRIGVKWDRLMENAKAFIATGANAEWTFIPFKHNQHQFEEIRRLHKELGFTRTNIQRCRRFDQWHVKSRYLSDGDKQYLLEPADSEYFQGKKKKKHPESCDKKCFLYHKKEIYVDCYGNVFPCCWYSTIPSTIPTSKISLYFHSIEDIVDTQFVKSTHITETWTDPKSFCNQNCWILE